MRKYTRLWWVSAVNLAAIVLQDACMHYKPVHIHGCALCLQMEPAKGAGFLAMYEAIGGKVSAA